ncbi:amidohydrolase [Glaciecola sp. 1036]|uniref:amidohydrolase n=1 Tax=Alteromonadaceae TaxID=72275 RepID=UPI003D045EBC
MKMKAITTLPLLISLVFVPVSLSAKTTHFTNINGYTLNQQGELVQFDEMLIEDDKVVSIGKPNTTSVDKVVDLQGKTLIPGLIDAHGHLLGLGENLTQVDLRTSESEQAAVKAITQFVSAHKTGVWVMGRGWNQVNWPSKQFPSKDSLDKEFADVPVYLSRIDGHAAWVNSKALEVAGINASTPAVEGGEIVKDENGNPTGVLIDNAMDLVWQHIPDTSLEQLRNQLDTAQQHLLSLGVTSMHDAGISQRVRDMYVEQAEAHRLNLRIYAMLAATDPNITEMLAQGHYQDEDEFLSIRSVKAYGDGALGSRGAALLAPYSDDPDNKGLLVTPLEELPAVFDLVIGEDFQLNFHAIGDRANRLVLQHFAKAFKKYPDNKQRHRIEHAQVIAVEDIPLFVEYGIIPSMQPTHATSDKNMAEDRLGAERLKGAYAWRTFLNQGSRIAFGSDFPVELANPFHGLHAAVTRQDGDNQPQGGWIPEESVTLLEAFRGFTIDAAYAAFQEDSIGQLSPGMKADFIIIDKDMFAIPASQIRDIQVQQTWVNGKQVF